MASGRVGNPNLGADAVGGRNQDRVVQARRFEVEQATESAQFRGDARSVGGLGQGPNGFDKGVADIDIDTGIFVTGIFAVIGPFLANTFLLWRAMVGCLMGGLRAEDKVSAAICND